MKTIYIDFSALGDLEDFYVVLKEKLTLPAFFGDNLDALEDVLTGETELPLHVEFVNLSVEQLDTFQDLLEMLEQIDEEVEDFSFSFFLEQFSDEEE